MPSPPRPPEEDSLALVVDEIWDLNAAIDELERRRAKLRAHVAAFCRDRRIDAWEHARGSLRIQRYESYKVARPSDVLEYVQMLGWADDALTVRGRSLHKLAQTDAKVRVLFDQTFPTVRHETLVMTPRRRP